LGYLKKGILRNPVDGQNWNLLGLETQFLSSKEKVRPANSVSEQKRIEFALETQSMAKTGFF